MKAKSQGTIAAQWGVLILALVLLAGAVVHNLYKSYNDILTGEEQRLLTQVRVVNANGSSLF